MNTAILKKSKAGSKTSGPTASGIEGYKGHKPGSRKETIHQLYDREGADTAWTRGLKMKLKEGTLRSWFGQWGHGSSKSKSKPASAKTPKPKERGENKQSKVAAIPEATIVSEPAAVAA